MRMKFDSSHFVCSSANLKSRHFSETSPQSSTHNNGMRIKEDNNIFLMRFIAFCSQFYEFEEAPLLRNVQSSAHNNGVCIKEDRYLRFCEFEESLRNVPSVFATSVVRLVEENRVLKNRENGPDPPLVFKGLLSLTVVGSLIYYPQEVHALTLGIPCLPRHMVTSHGALQNRRLNNLEATMCFGRRGISCELFGLTGYTRLRRLRRRKRARLQRQRQMKNMLLNPIRSSEVECRRLKINVDDMPPRRYFKCGDTNCWFNDFPNVSVFFSGLKCDCGKPLDKKVYVRGVMVLFRS
ncbi:hypothetical protein STAS_18075 [Striga asiatica]|uniref:Uncharacterized protein n=1 Tax=Striga asiatica TaxID=4170 RepID=A0A5A7Q7X8_STRAF|nr:hypothetical protein STAS_18075 [Striga asiatica]